MLNLKDVALIAAIVTLVFWLLLAISLSVIYVVDGVLNLEACRSITVMIYWTIPAILAGVTMLIKWMWGK